MNKPHTLHRYQVHLIPNNINAENIEPAFEAGQLPHYPLTAASSEQAAASAKTITGMRVHSVERIDGPTPIKTQAPQAKPCMPSSHVGYINRRGEFIPGQGVALA